MMKLCVNIDHVATVREARKTYEPDPIAAAKEAVLGGADGITLHIREDRRHMQDHDLTRLMEQLALPINLEMAATGEMINIAIATKPNMVMLVPEGRNEITTEGGLDICADQAYLRDTVAQLHDAGLRVSAFIDGVENQIDAARAINCDVCEIHTGPFAEEIEQCNFSLEHPNVEAQIVRIIEATAAIRSRGMQCNAGHGLNYRNVPLIAGIAAISELHIGHSIVSRSIFVGMRNAVKEMQSCIQRTLA